MSKIKVIKNFFLNYKNSDKIFKATIWFVLVTIIDNCISIITQPFVNRILSVEQVGVYNVFFTWTTLFRIVATFNLFCGVYEVLLVDQKEEQEHVRESLCLLSIILTCIFFGIIFVFISPISTLLQLKFEYLIVMFFMVLSEMIIQFYVVQLRFNYQYIRYSVFVVTLFLLKSVLTVLFSHLFVTERALGRMLGLLVPSFLVAMVLLVIMLRKLSLKGITKYWKQSLKFNLPLIPHYLSSVVLASSDKLMIRSLSSEYYVGLYSVVYSYANLSQIIFTAINNSYTPWAYEAIRQKKYSALKLKTNMILLVSVLFCVLMMLLAPEGILILGSEKYLKALNIVPVLILGAFLSSFYFVFSNVEFINKKTKLVFPITILGAGINIVLNGILIPIFGYEMAAYTTVIGYAIIAACHYIYSYKIVKEHIFDLRFILFMILLLVGGCIGCIWLYKIHFLIRYFIAVCFGLFSLRLMIKFVWQGESSLQ